MSDEEPIPDPRSGPPYQRRADLDRLYAAGRGGVPSGLEGEGAGCGWWAALVLTATLVAAALLGRFW